MTKYFAVALLLASTANAGVVKYVFNASPKKVATQVSAPIRHPKKSASAIEKGSVGAAKGAAKGVKSVAKVAF